MAMVKSEFMFYGDENAYVKLVIKCVNDVWWKLYIVKKVPDYWNGYEESDLLTSIYLGGGHKESIIKGFVNAYNDVINNNKLRCVKFENIEFIPIVTLSGYTMLNVSFPPESKLIINYGNNNFLCKMLIALNMKDFGEWVKSLKLLP